VLTKLGLDFTPEEERAYFHCWMVIGHFMGIRHTLLPRDLEEGQQLWESILQHQVAPSESGAALTKALVDYLKLRIPGTRIDGLAVTMIRELCGDEVSDAVGLEKKDWTQHLLGPIRLAFHLADEAQDHLSLAAKISASLSRRLIEGLHASERGGKRVTFRIPQSLQDAWGVNTPPSRSPHSPGSSIRSQSQSSHDGLASTMFRPSGDRVRAWRRMGACTCH
jgi:hypothetical protein